MIANFDMDSLAARVRQRREATGLALNVRFLNEDGKLDEWSFASPDRADAFRAKLTAKGQAIVDRAGLAAMYVDRIGYDPFEDDPTISEGDVARTLIEYQAAAS